MDLPHFIPGEGEMAVPKRAEPTETLDRILNRLLDTIAADHHDDKPQTVEEAVRRIENRLPTEDGNSA
jgi:hypothetical protein